MVTKLHIIPHIYKKLHDFETILTFFYEITRGERHIKSFVQGYSSRSAPILKRSIIFIF